MACFVVAALLQQSTVDQDNDGDTDLTDAVLQISDFDGDGKTSTFEASAFSGIVAFLVALVVLLLGLVVHLWATLNKTEGKLVETKETLARTEGNLDETTKILTGKEKIWDETEAALIETKGKLSEIKMKQPSLNDAMFWGGRGNGIVVFGHSSMPPSSAPLFKPSAGAASGTEQRLFSFTEPGKCVPCYQYMY